MTAHTPFTPFTFTDDDLGRLGDAVGPMEVNRSEDVAKLETALERLGRFPVDPDQGPSGTFHSELKDSLEGFQRDNGLTADATAKPGGPTITAMAEQVRNDPVRKRRESRKRLGERTGKDNDDQHATPPSRPATGDGAINEGAGRELDKRAKDPGRIRENPGRPSAPGGGDPFNLNPKIKRRPPKWPDL